MSHFESTYKIHWRLFPYRTFRRGESLTLFILVSTYWGLLEGYVKFCLQKTCCWQYWLDSEVCGPWLCNIKGTCLKAKYGPCATHGCFSLIFGGSDHPVAMEAFLQTSRSFRLNTKNSCTYPASAAYEDLGRPLPFLEAPDPLGGHSLQGLSVVGQTRASHLASRWFCKVGRLVTPSREME